MYGFAKMEKVSVIIPTYNRMDIISDAIDSVLSQTYPEIELIIVNDGSTDNTLDVLEKYGGKIKIISQKNKGCSAARNTGIKYCSGEYIAFLDSDDKWLPVKIEKQVELLDKAGKRAPCCWCNLLIESNGKTQNRMSMDYLHPKYSQGIWLNPIEILAKRFILFNQAVIVRRNALEQIGYFDESLWVMEDYDFAIRLALIGPWAYTNEPLVVCRDIATNRITYEAFANLLKLQEICTSIYDKYINDPVISRKAIRHLKINRYFSTLNYKICKQKKENAIGSAFQTFTSYYLRTIKFIHRLYISIINDMKTIPFG